MPRLQLRSKRDASHKNGARSLVTNILQLPLWMLPAVRIAMNKGFWRVANDPLKSVRENGWRESTRMGLNGKPAANGE